MALWIWISSLENLNHFSVIHNGCSTTSRGPLNRGRFIPPEAVMPTTKATVVYQLIIMKQEANNKLPWLEFITHTETWKFHHHTERKDLKIPTNYTIWPITPGNHLVQLLTICMEHLCYDCRPICARIVESQEALVLISGSRWHADRALTVFSWSRLMMVINLHDDYDNDRKWWLPF